MRTICLAVFAVLFATAAARGQTATGPAADDFQSKVDLTLLRLMVVQHNQTLKTLDSYCREVLEQVTGHQTWNGEDPVYTVLDLAFRSKLYDAANVLKIKSLPLRSDFKQLPGVDDKEADRIERTGMVSPGLMTDPAVDALLQKVQSSDVRKAQAVQQLMSAGAALDGVCSLSHGKDFFLGATVVPPAVGAKSDQWVKVIDVIGYDPKWVALSKKTGAANASSPPLPAGYTSDQIGPVVAGVTALAQAWQERDVAKADAAAASFAAAAQAVNPAAYPPELKRHAEVVYNKLAKMTIPGAAFYFIALVCFVAGGYSGVTGLRLWGLRAIVIAFAVHTAGIAVRWWLVGSIPIKNEFESVMFSAWFGVGVGTALELRWGRGIFGAAASFVGWLSLVALFAVPYVFNASIGQNIEQVNGVLMSYWLYIHVTMVTASYALIGMGFALSVWWLVKYYADYGTLSRVGPRQLEGDARGFDVAFAGAGGMATLTAGQTLLRLVGFPVTTAAPAVAKLRRPATAETAVARQTSFMAALDACNLVVLQLAFWTLGTGIILGAVWADMSWGRPWAFDPKETFALVTWIVYLMVVHVRVATPHKAWWTAVLSSVGFFVMLFNWIGVNYFLPGLHSYA